MLRTRKIAIFGFLVTVMLCAAIGTLGFVLRPRTFSTRHAALIYTLEQRGFVVDELTFDRRWPDTVNTLVYGAGLAATIRGVGPVVGRFECRDMTHDCRVSFAKLRMNRVPVPDVTTAKPPDLLLWIEEWLERLRP